MVDRVPTMKTSNCRMCLLLANGQMGMLQIEDAERLQARLRRTQHTCLGRMHYILLALLAAGLL